MTTQTGFMLRGWHVLAAMIGFFGIVIAVNVAFSIAALRSFPGEDVDHPYVQGIEYNHTLAERRAEAALGWRAEVSLADNGKGAAMLRADLRDRNGRPLEGLTVDGALRWPASASRDHALRFQQVGPGRYEAAIGALQPGRWDLRAEARNAQGGALTFESELSWQISH